MTLPILVEQLTREQATAIACGQCGWHGHDDNPADGRVYEFLECPSCHMGGSVDYVYEVGVRCGSCGDMNYEQPVDGRFCSRVCQLQAEYATELAKRAAS